MAAPHLAAARNDTASRHHRQTCYLPGLPPAWPCPAYCIEPGGTERNGIERDHGFLKERLRPMRGFKSVGSATIFTRGHALMRNIRRGFYRVIEAVPQRLVFAWTWSRLAAAV